MLRDFSLAPKLPPYWRICCIGTSLVGTYRLQSAVRYVFASICINKILISINR